MNNTPRLYFNIAIIIFLGLMVFIGFRYGQDVPADTTVAAAIDTAVVITEPLRAPIEIQRRIKGEEVRNVILLVGDGMGLSQVTAGYYAGGQQTPLQRCQHVGVMTVHSATSIITDSAAGATAFATGKKTRNGMIGMTPDSVPRKSLIDYAEENNLSTGIVVTSTVTHATPASFYGHSPSRSRVNERIASQFMEQDIEVLMGGGKAYFDSGRVDGRNLLQELRDRGYGVIDSMDEAEGNTYDKLVCLISRTQPVSLIDGRRKDFLPRGTAKAIEVLDHNPNGFFLMIEGSQIDWGGHENDVDYIVQETLEFNKTIAAVLDFAEREGNTLVIVTADHETGGFSINDGIMKDSIVRGEFTTDYHTCTMVPVFAYGPGSELFSGMYDNTDIFYKVLQAFGFALTEDAL
jgi:alkaline phosphatase